MTEFNSSFLVSYSMESTIPKLNIAASSNYRGQV